MSLLVVDVGTSGVRAAVIRPDASVAADHHVQVLPDTPMAGLVEFDAHALAEAALEGARRVLAAAGPVEAVGIANQRASTVVWDRATGEAVAPGLGWQDLRTVGECLALQAEDIYVAPNHSATKAAALLDQVDPDRRRDLCVGTVDSWIAWQLSDGALHVTDTTNASVTGLLHLDGRGWDERVLEVLRIPAGSLPAVVASTGAVGQASALDGSPPIAGIAGDQQASLIGQGCVRPGRTKITFGTGGMLDRCVGSDRPEFARRGPGGTFPIVAWDDGDLTWAVEAVMLSAGTNVEWLRDDLGVIETAAQSDAVAASCDGTDGVVFVPALLGLGTPEWDYGARGTLLGVTRGTTSSHLVRAVLEGVAQRAADLVEAAETDSAGPIETLRVDGGMIDNPTFVQAVADASRLPVEVSPVREATTLGAAFLAGLHTGAWTGWDDIDAAWSPSVVVEPGRALDRERWREAVRRAVGWEEGLSGIDFAD